jgi:hypothetical protein
MRNALPVVLLMAATAAQAQFPYMPAYDYYPRQVYYPLGYRFYGWGGWGTRVQSSVARGMAIYASNVTQANMRAAQAQSEAQRAEMIKLWNTYLWMAQNTVNRLNIADHHPEVGKDPAAIDLIVNRIRDNPEPGDIESGDTLNAIHDQLSDPLLTNLAGRLPRAPLDPKLIKEIPFAYSSEVITFLLQKMATDLWPPFLRAPALDEPRRALQAAADAAFAEDLKGELQDDSTKNVYLAMQNLSRAIPTVLPRNSPFYARAEDYFKVLVGLTRMLRKPKYDEVLAALDRQPNSSLDDLLAFMQIFNLRFGEASTPRQRAAYQTLYPLLAQRRAALTQLLGGRLPPDPPAFRPDGDAPLAVFSRMSWEDLAGQPAANTPRPQLKPQR